MAIDFCFYWMHRAKHQWAWWWRLHETHHSSRDLDWFSFAVAEQSRIRWSAEAEFDADYRELVKSFQSLKSKPKVFVCRPVPVPGKGNYGINEENIQKEIPRVDALVAMVPQELGITIAKAIAASADLKKSFVTVRKRAASDFLRK